MRMMIILSPVACGFEIGPLHWGKNRG